MFSCCHPRYTLDVNSLKKTSTLCWNYQPLPTVSNPGELCITVGEPARRPKEWASVGKILSWPSTSMRGVAHTLDTCGLEHEYDKDTLETPVNFIHSFEEIYIIH